MQPDVSAHAVLDHLPEGGDELTRLVGAEKPRDGLLDDLVLSEAEEVGHGAEALSVVGIISPDALRDWSRTLRVTSRSTTSRRATTNSRASS